MARNRALNIDQGEDFAISWVWKQGPTQASAVAVDLTGWDAKLQIRTRKGGRLLDEFTVGAGLTIPTPVNGRVTLEIDNATSAAWTWRRAFYDLYVWNVSGADIGGLSDKRIIEGQVVVDQRVTVP